LPFISVLHVFSRCRPWLNKQATYDCWARAMDFCEPGRPYKEIGGVIEDFVRQQGFTTVKVGARGSGVRGQQGLHDGQGGCARQWSERSKGASRRCRGKKLLPGEREEFQIFFVL
jgi:hypothetical protein